MSNKSRQLLLLFMFICVGSSGNAYGSWSQSRCNQHWKTSLDYVMGRNNRRRSRHKALLHLQRALPHCKRAEWAARAAEWAERLGRFDQVINHYQQALSWSKDAKQRQQYRRWSQHAQARFRLQVKRTLRQPRPTHSLTRGEFKLVGPVLQRRRTIERNACQKKLRHPTKQGRRKPRGARVFPRMSVGLQLRVLFASGSHTIQREGHVLLKQLAASVKKILTSKHCLLIIGHTDNVSGLRYNLRLSRLRAASVKVLLQRAGIATRQLATNGMAYLQPIASNNTPEGKQHNRRVEIILRK